MTGRELVDRAMTFRSPESIPKAKGRDADMAIIGYGPARDFCPLKKGMDEWGCLRVSLNPDSGDQGQVFEHPLSDWRRADDDLFPDPYAPGRFDRAGERLQAHRRSGRFVFGSLGKGPMHLLDDLRGFENYLSDLLLHPERVEFMLDGVFRFLDALLEKFADLGVDGVYLVDDQAIQSGPLFSMDLWRRHFLPRYRRLFHLAHERGLAVYMHTCGDISKHLTGLVDAGVDMIDNKQPALWMDSEAMRLIRGKVAFSSCLDIQSVMQTIPFERIGAETARLIRSLSIPDGGFIATWYDKPDLQLEKVKVQRMIDAFDSFQWTI